MNENQDSKNATAIAVAKQDREVSYRVFGSDENIRLSIAIVRATLVKPTRSGAMPCDADVVKFMMMCKAKGLNPYEGDAFLVGYDGRNGPEFSLIGSHQALLKRAEVNPEYDGLESGVIVKTDEGSIVERECDFLYPGDELLGAWATVYFKKDKRPRKSKINLNVYAKDTQFWRGNPGGMIVKCAEADALRGSFPTKLGGLYIAQEMARIERGESIDVQSAVAVQDTKGLVDRREEAMDKWREAGRKVSALTEQIAPTDPELADAGLAPATPASAPAQSATESATVYEQLGRILDANGITFDALRRWLDETGQLSNSDSFGSIDELPKIAVEKCVKQSRVIIKSLKTT